MADAQTEKSKNPHRSWPRKARGGGEQACGVEGCKRPYRAKGYCFFHYKKWRQGDLPHSRYRTCSRTECRKKAEKAGLCAQHHAEAYKKEGASA